MKASLSAVVLSILSAPLHTQPTRSLEHTNMVLNVQVANLEMPLQLSGNVISPLLFGHNFEITRKASWQGLAAEMLANRKFAAVVAKFSDTDVTRVLEASRTVRSSAKNEASIGNTLQVE